MSLFSFRHHRNSDDDDTYTQMQQRFEEIASATPELGGFGPRDWSPPEDDGAFNAPDPKLTPVSLRVKLGWILLTASIIGFFIIEIGAPQLGLIGAVFCLILLAISLTLLLFSRHS